MQAKTYLVLAQYRESSAYSDKIGGRYHFPKKYFNFFTLPDIEFVYYEPKKAGEGKYFGYGEIGTVTSDPQNLNHFFAEILNYRPFPNPVPGRDDQGNPRESPPFFNPQNAVRRVDPEVFLQICADGGLELTALGVESENAESDEVISEPFDPSKIKVDREPMTILQVLRKFSFDEVILDPEFQRNLVWDPVRRSRLIESVLLRIPLPAFYFDGVDANSWAVVDGLQRLSTLKDFADNKFRLQNLEYLKLAEGSTFDDLPRGLRRDFEDTQVTLFIIRPETPPDVKFTIFYRINTGGLVLTPQEIRHALFRGEAAKLLSYLSKTEEFLRATAQGVSDTRMDARECVLRYLAFHMQSYEQYIKPDLNGFLSAAMKDINRMSAKGRGELEINFREAMTRAEAVFGEYAFRRINNNTLRRGPINKALFESWSNVLQQYPLTDLLTRRDELRKILFEMFSDPEYLRSLSAGTGSVTSVRTRFERAHRIIQRALS